MMKFAKNPSFLTACLIALLTGAIGTFAYSPFDHWYLAYVSAAGLIWTATRPVRKIALWASFVWSLGYFGAGVSWVHISMIQFGGVPEIVSYLAVLLLAAYLGLYNVLFSYVAQRFNLRNPVVLASIFTFTEYLRGTVMTGFPWLQFGYSQIDTPFAHIAPVFGVEGVTFFVMVVSGYLLKVLAQLFRQAPFSLDSLAILAIIVLISIDSKDVRFVKVDNEKAPVTVSLVQGNIEQKMKWDPAYFQQTIQTYERLIAPLLGKSDVIILPESAIPALEDNISPLLEQLQHVGEQKGSELIIGTLYQNEQQALFNSAIVLGNKAFPYNQNTMNSIERYKKHHLVPFGEYLPFGMLLDWMRDVFILPVNLSQGDFVQKPLVAKNQRFNMAICYEIIFGDQVQKNQQAHNADYLLTITNDAWFGSSIGPWQHFQMARMRALELGKPLVRAANTGITAIVNSDGKVAQQIPQFEANVLTAEIKPYKGETLFSQFGNVFVYGFSLLTLVVGVIMARRRK